jgi:hypothetical protein
VIEPIDRYQNTGISYLERAICGNIFEDGISYVEGITSEESTGADKVSFFTESHILDATVILCL